MNEPINTIEYSECKIKIYQDDDPPNPRDNNIGQILYTSSRYTLGDRRTTASEIEAIIEDDGFIYLPVYAYVHSGTCLNTTGFSCPWDSGQCGIIYCNRESAQKEYPHLSGQELEDAVKKYFEIEVQEYVAEDCYGNEIGSCWGFSSEQDAIDAAKDDINSHNKQPRKNKAVEFIVCFADSTWEYKTYYIPEALWLQKDRKEVEDRLKNEIELHNRNVVAFFLSWWGEDE